MKLADKPVYPIHYEDSDGNPALEAGLTYKQWLVGMLASNSQIIRKIEISADFEHYAEMLMLQANAIISELEKENE